MPQGSTARTTVSAYLVVAGSLQLLPLLLLLLLLLSNTVQFLRQNMCCSSANE
jgi:hypothetical protein